MKNNNNNNKKEKNGRRRIKIYRKTTLNIFKKKAI